MKMKKDQNTFLVIDGHNFLYRGYYGVPLAAKLPSGLEINAVYGFFSLLRNTVSYLNPNQLLVVFDTETGIQNKLNQFPEYKANREYEETSIFEQLELIKKILTVQDIAQVESDNHEADDLIGSFISQQEKHNASMSFIGSTDADFIQLISPNINIIKSRHSNMEIIDEQAVIDKFAVNAESYLHLHALKGDSSDNIEGIRGIGLKTASKLVKEYRTIDGIFQNIDKLPLRLQQLLNGKHELLNRIKDFITIKTDLEIGEFNQLSISFVSEQIPQNTRHVLLEILN